MSPPNIVLLVVDTLRDDHAGELSRLAEMGFDNYPNAISQSPWTLPSHASIFTGELPSVHGAHEQEGMRIADLLPLSKARLGQRQTLTGILKGVGYTTYGLSANPIVSPLGGFSFDEYHGFNTFGDVIEEEILFAGVSSRGGRLAAAVRAGGFAQLFRVAGRRASIALKGSMKLQQMDKGSTGITSYLSTHKLKRPYFLFVNLMEAHEPYQFNEDIGRVAPCIVGRPVRSVEWKTFYPMHARLAVSRALQIAALLLGSDPLFVVTSDHGQLLGERGRFGHSYFLDDELVRVPLYIREPGRAHEIVRRGDFVSLSELFGLMTGYAMGRRPRVGSDSALSESFGTWGRLSRLGVLTPLQVANIFSHRRRVLTRKGSATKNFRSGTVEIAGGYHADGEADSLTKELGEPVRPADEREQFPPHDESVLLGRLKELGYE